VSTGPWVPGRSIAEPADGVSEIKVLWTVVAIAVGLLLMLVAGLLIQPNEGEQSPQAPEVVVRPGQGAG
jgi:hypothetical protein